jgi:hypothetical protein
MKMKEKTFYTLTLNPSEAESLFTFIDWSMKTDWSEVKENLHDSCVSDIAKLRAMLAHGMR